MPAMNPPTPKLEIRNLAILPEIRTKDQGTTLAGYASRFNEAFNPYLWWPEFSEVVGPGAFDRTLRDRPDVRALRNHDTDKVLGRGKNNTLRLWTDAVGLPFEVDLNMDTTLGKDTYSDVTRGDIDGCSIGFIVQRDQVVYDRETDLITRTILDVDLFEITPACTFPANESTSVEVRSALMAQIHSAAKSTPNLDLIRLIRRRRGR